MSETESPIDTVDPIVRSLLPGYLTRRREEHAKLVELLAGKQFVELRVIGHNLSGSGGAYGLPGLTEIGRRIEMAAADSNAAGIAAQLDEMDLYLERVQAELD